MKNLMPLLFIALLFVACEDTETNSATVQASIDSVFFKAYTASGVMDFNDQSVTIVGLSDGSQELTIHTDWWAHQSYSVGADSKSYASFTDADGIVFTTKNEGSIGEIIITNRNDLH